MSTKINTKKEEDLLTQIQTVKDLVAPDATNQELLLFAEYCKSTGLNPLASQIHFVKRGGKASFQTSIDGYRLIAERAGSYAGNDDYRFDEGMDEYSHVKSGRGNPVTATSTIYKIVSGQRVPFTATARWDEYFPGEAKGFMWKKMPYLMLGKCAEALALRKAFPNDLSGLYTDDEMAQADKNTEGSQVQAKSVPVSDRTVQALEVLNKADKLEDLQQFAKAYSDLLEDPVVKEAATLRKATIVKTMEAIQPEPVEAEVVETPSIKDKVEKIRQSAASIEAEKGDQNG